MRAHRLRSYATPWVATHRASHFAHPSRGAGRSPSAWRAHPWPALVVVPLGGSSARGPPSYHSADHEGEPFRLMHLRPHRLADITVRGNPFDSRPCGGLDSCCEAARIAFTSYGLCVLTFCVPVSPDMVSAVRSGTNRDHSLLLISRVTGGD